MLDTEITPNSFRLARRCRAARPRSDLRPYRTFRQVLRYGPGPSKVVFLAWHAWNDAEWGNYARLPAKSERLSYSLGRNWALAADSSSSGFICLPALLFGIAQRPQGVPRGALSPRGDSWAPSDVSNLA